MSIEKMTTMEQVETRANLYRLATEAFESEGFATQPIKGGRLIGLGNGHYAKVAISICDPDKVDNAIQAYADQMRVNAAHAAERAAKAEEKACKAAARAAKREAKATE